MSDKALVQYDNNSSVDCLIEQAHKNEIALNSQDVSVERAAAATDEEVWSPRLPAYQAWVAKRADEADERGHDGDLLLVGSLGMGISDEARESIIAPAVKGLPEEEVASARWVDQVGEESRASHVERAEQESRGLLRDGFQLADALGVRRDETGYTLTKVDLRLFAAHFGWRNNLVVVLPASIQGVPLVRIAAEAFSRRFVQGVGVRLLVVPSTVERIDAGAFSVLSAKHLHLGKGVRVLGDQPSDMAGVSPRLAKREYSVDPRNQHFAAQDGGLFSHDGTQLLFFPSPYAHSVELPASVVQVGAAAFASGGEPPKVVYCSEALAQVASKAWDEAVWFCPPSTPVASQLLRRGVRMAHSRMVEFEGCWYDLDGEKAVLIAGPPPAETPSKRFAAQAALRAAAVRGQHELPTFEGSPEGSKAGAGASVTVKVGAEAPVGGRAVVSPGVATDTLVLPSEIDGLPLVCLGAHALPYAPATLIIPSTVKEILPNNAARGVRHLSLPTGLLSIGAHSFCSRILEGVVSLPASLAAIGEGCFEYAVCRLEHVGARVHLSADQLQSCFVGAGVDLEKAAAVPFDFVCYDTLLCSGKNLPDKMGAVLYRLAVPYNLSTKHREALVDYLCNHEREALERIALEGDRSMIESLVNLGFINENTFDLQIELLRAKNRTDCVIYLMEHRQKQRLSKTGGEVGAEATQSRFAL